MPRLLIEATVKFYKTFLNVPAEMNDKNRLVLIFAHRKLTTIAKVLSFNILHSAVYLKQHFGYTNLY